MVPAMTGTAPLSDILLVVAMISSWFCFVIETVRLRSQCTPGRTCRAVLRERSARNLQRCADVIRIIVFRVVPRFEGCALLWDMRSLRDHRRSLRG